MATYSYIVTDQRGKEKKGTLEAGDRHAAAVSLKQQGYVLIQLQEASALDKDIELSFLDKKPKPREMAIFCRQFLSILSAGVPMIKALSMMTLQTGNKVLRAAIDDCRQEIEKGSMLADAMKRHRDVFSDFFITLVAAGEASGSLETSLDRMATQFEKDAKLKETISKASIYPTIVCVVSVIVVIVMLTFVVPSFESMLTDLGSELPAITVFVVNASEFMQKWWYLIVAALAGLFLFARYFKKTDGGKHFFDKITMKLPMLGDLTIKTASARMARTLATILASGLSLIDALEIVADTMTNIYFKEALLQVRDEVAMGAPLAECIERTKLFPPLVYQMISVGEETGEIDKMLLKLAEYYEDEVETATAKVMTALEPMIIIVLVVVVGGIIMSVMLPMFNMYSALDNL